MMGFKATISSGSTSDIIKWIWETVFQMQTQQQTCQVISVSQSVVIQFLKVVWAQLGS